MFHSLNRSLRFTAITLHIFLIFVFHFDISGYNSKSWSQFNVNYSLVQLVVMKCWLYCTINTKNHKTKVNALHCALNWLDLMCDVEGGREIQLISVIKISRKTSSKHTFSMNDYGQFESLTSPHSPSSWQDKFQQRVIDTAKRSQVKLFIYSLKHFIINYDILYINFGWC